MLFWLFMTTMNLVIPLTMVFFGGHFIKSPPDKINRYYGYRTGLSMESRENWDFAHRHFGRCWKKIGLILLPISVAVMLPVLGKDEDTIGCWGSAVMLLQIIPLVLPVIFTQRALKKLSGDK